MTDEWDDEPTEWRAADVGEPAADDEPGDADRAAAVRTVRLVAAAGVLAVLGVLAVVLAGAFDDDDDGGSGEDQVVLEEGALAIGPATGETVDAYIERRRAVLAEAGGEHLAVVSLVSYRGAAAVEELLGAEGLAVEAMLVALPGGRPTVTDAPVATWIDDQRAPLQAERDEIAGLLPTIEDPNDPFIAGYTEDLARLDAQLAALDAAADLVFGAVVRGDAEDLRALAARPEVRLVDLADGVDDLDGRRVAALRPEETSVTGDPPARPT